MTIPTTRPMLKAALHYATRFTLPVFPLEPRGKRPLTQHGFKDASTDQGQIRAWWTEYALANIGIPTGGASGFVVLDVDPRNGGDVSLEDLLLTHGALPETPNVATGGGGKHYWFAVPSTLVAGAVLAPGVDLKAEGGYVVVPPSIHPSGESYRWLSLPDDIPFAPLPAWIVESAGEPTGSTGAAQPLPETIEEGLRNALLLSLGGSMRRRGASEAAIAAALATENAARCRPPLADSEVASIARSVSRYAPAVTLVSDSTAPEGQRLETAPGPDVTAETEPAGTSGSSLASPVADPAPDLTLTDLGNAELFSRQHAHHLKAVPGQGWIHWDGRVWQRDSDGVALRLAFQTVRSLYLAAAAAPTTKKAQAIGKHAIASEGARKLKAIPDLAQAIKTMRVDGDALDSDPMLLAVENGVLDLETGHLHPHEAMREKYLTRMAPVAYDPDASETEWSRFLFRIMNGNANLLAFLQRAIGYAITGSTREQVLFILYGSGRNGKSTFMEAVRATFGPYCLTTTADTIMTKYGGGGIPNDIARLRGSRLVAAGELNQGRRIDAALVKRLVSEDTITARFLRQEFFEFRPSFKLFLHTNHKPEVTDSSEAMWRRVRLVPFLVTIPIEEQDQHLLEKLLTEKSGILNWALTGCLDWQHRGLKVPEEVERATYLYRHEEDRTQLFLDECCETNETYRTSSKNLYERFKSWCDGIGEKPPALRTFNSSIAEHGYQHVTVRVGPSVVRGWAGLRPRDYSTTRYAPESE